MANKRYMSPEATLQRVIRDLEDARPASHHRAVLALLARGPLHCRLALPADADVRTWRAELLRFVRALVRADVDSPDAQIGTYGYVTFTGHLQGARVGLDAGGKDARDLVVLQFVILLHDVGLQHVRLCQAPDCHRVDKGGSGRRLFVKFGRREFCSARCQKRTYMRQRRENEARRRQRRVGRGK